MRARIVTALGSGQQSQLVALSGRLQAGPHPPSMPPSSRRRSRSANPQSSPYSLRAAVPCPCLCRWLTDWSSASSANRARFRSSMASRSSRPPPSFGSPRNPQAYSRFQALPRNRRRWCCESIPAAARHRRIIPPRDASPLIPGAECQGPAHDPRRLGLRAPGDSQARDLCRRDRTGGDSGRHARRFCRFAQRPAEAQQQRLHAE